jgi:hypothetical protein
LSTTPAPATTRLKSWAGTSVYRQPSAVSVLLCVPLQGEVAILCLHIINNSILSNYSICHLLMLRLLVYLIYHCCSKW